MFPQVKSTLVATLFATLLVLSTFPIISTGEKRKLPNSLHQEQKVLTNNKIQQHPKRLVRQFKSQQQNSQVNPFTQLRNKIAASNFQITLINHSKFNFNMQFRSFDQEGEKSNAFNFVMHRNTCHRIINVGVSLLPLIMVKVNEPGQKYSKLQFIKTQPLNLSWVIPRSVSYEIVASGPITNAKIGLFRKYSLRGEAKHQSVMAAFFQLFSLPGGAKEFFGRVLGALQFVVSVCVIAALGLLLIAIRTVMYLKPLCEKIYNRLFYTMMTRSVFVDEVDVLAEGGHKVVKYPNIWRYESQQSFDNLVIRKAELIRDNKAIRRTINEVAQDTKQSVINLKDELKDVNFERATEQQQIRNKYDQAREEQNLNFKDKRSNLIEKHNEQMKKRYLKLEKLKQQRDGFLASRSGFSGAEERTNGVRQEVADTPGGNRVSGKAVIDPKEGDLFSNNDFTQTTELPTAGGSNHKEETFFSDNKAGAQENYVTVASGAGRQIETSSGDRPTQNDNIMASIGDKRQSESRSGEQLALDDIDGAAHSQTGQSLSATTSINSSDFSRPSSSNLSLYKKSQIKGAHYYGGSDLTLIPSGDLGGVTNLSVGQRVYLNSRDTLRMFPNTIEKLADETWFEYATVGEKARYSTAVQEYNGYRDSVISGATDKEYCNTEFLKRANLKENRVSIARFLFTNEVSFRELAETMSRNYEITSA